MELIQT